MAMHIGPGDPTGGQDPEPILEINTTPLIDVMLVLLVMLIITIPIQLHATDLNLPAPRAQAAPPPERPVVRLDIDASGAVRWQGEALADAAQLDARLRTAAAQEPQPEIHVRPDADCRYEAFAAVMVAAQKAGLVRLGLAGGERFE
jgi:biopolymer transport protein ExbD